MSIPPSRPIGLSPLACASSRSILPLFRPISCHVDLTSHVGRFQPPPPHHAAPSVNNKPGGEEGGCGRRAVEDDGGCDLRAMRSLAPSL
ncbi:Hypothetical protein NTJ_15191 [Nesidiocoris tenuis]|uniref:Uncharacterized protein n=1 Tax=Nesidiocoris tenuis TaxID=355587 RepID=A0ABN7BDC1_9HEMI|nr:Hypothetical protein NTJ_15191 [Nesidiocoris tenuis]